MPGEPPIDADCAILLGSRLDFIHIEPQLVAFRLPQLSLAVEEDVDDDIRAGIAAEAALGHADRGDQVSGFGDLLTAVVSALSIVPCEVTKAASAPGFRRSIDGNEIVVQPEAERPIGPVGSDRAIGEGGFPMARS